MHHHCLISKANRDGCDLKDIFPVALFEVVKDRLKHCEVAQTIRFFQDKQGFLSVDRDFSSLAVKDLRPDQH